MEGCGVEYAPLVVATSLNVGVVAGVSVPCGVLCVAVAVYAACCYGRRSNSAAPKDAGVPFAMVFTDIQSSTSLWARAPEQTGEALEQHHDVLRLLIGRYDGYEVKTIGDSFMVAFKRASDAAAFGLAIQTALYGAAWPDEIDDVYVSLAQEAYEELLVNEDPKKAAASAASGERKTPQWEDEVNYPLNWNGIRVRVGLHWGVGSVKFDAVSQGYDYYGTLVNTAARVEGVGNGGQVLATRDLYARLEEEGFDLGGVEVTALGPQPLRGLDEPVPLYQLCPAALRGREFAALRLIDWPRWCGRGGVSMRCQWWRYDDKWDKDRCCVFCRRITCWRTTWSACIGGFADAAKKNRFKCVCDKCRCAVIAMQFCLLCVCFLIIGEETLR
ncbi:receptor-type adenylate cyclase, putative [Bodo saltans]|uniref:adenylate cyclase n=1 Tax=Bodo saltans TaxID=75058 RepID=A0A0S4J0V5_BODSA|nr:receptor-type adenylate cyclase, putative [Bodo saltans]|eukprot:CUG46572.1 receptor-type adenylate cyclase, putative [Bodo saltans]